MELCPGVMSSPSALNHPGAGERPQAQRAADGKDCGSTQMQYDLLIKGGTVVDPSQGLNSVRDVAFSNGKVAALDDGVSEDLAREVVDATGLIVTPGLVDLHVHAFWGASEWGIEPDPTNVARGVTTALDAGSAGAHNFPAFRKYVLERCATRLYALLNVSTIGIPSHLVGEVEGLRWVDVARTVEVARANSQYILGIKARLGKAQAGRDDGDALKCAIEAAEALDKFVMIHVGNTTTSLEKLVGMLRPGDVVTHCFHDLPHGILDDSGRVLESIQEAQQRGIIFDVGHGAGSFTFDVAYKALSQGFHPGNISSDLHFYSIQGAVPDFLAVLTKFMYLGMSLDEVVRLTTKTAAETMGLDGKLGTLKVGAEGDATVMRLEEGRFALTDSAGVTVESEQRLAHVCTIRCGQVYRAWLGAPQTVEPVQGISWNQLLR